MVEAGLTQIIPIVSDSEVPKRPDDVNQLSLNFVANVESTWGQAARKLLATLRSVGVLNGAETKFKFEVTASVDSAVGSHLDIDLSCRLDHEQNYRFRTHVTILSDQLMPQHQERAKYIQVLIEAEGRMFIIDPPYEYLIELKREITQSDSLSLASALFGPLSSTQMKLASGGQ